MQIKKNVVAITDDKPFVVDLEDFPHGELVSVRKDEKYDIEFYSVAPGTYVMAYNESTGLPEFKEVKFWSIHRGKPIEIVNLEDGRQIVTDNDPRAVYGISCEGDTMECARFTPSAAMDGKVMVPVTNSPLASIADGLYYGFDDGLIGVEGGDCKVEFDFDFGQFVGLIVGDGWSDVDYNSYLADNEGYNIAFLTEFLRGGPYPGFYSTSRKHLASEEKGRYGDTTRFRLNAGTKQLGRRIKELVDGHGDDTTSGSANKRLPIWYQFAGKDFILGLVNGMIATDGTVCVSHGKSKPQLQISFSSTSLRLVREFKRCCQLLGVHASISFSKNTSGGNTSWLCSVSTIDAKRVGLLDRCCHVRKRDVFRETYVDISDRNVKNDIVPFPKGVASRIVPLVPAAKTSGVDLDSLGEEEKRRRLRYQAMAINTRRLASEGFITRSLVRRLKALGDEIANNNISKFSAGFSLLSNIENRFSELLANDDGGSRRSWKCNVAVCEAETLSDMIASTRPRFCDSWGIDVRSTTIAISQCRKKGFMTWAQLCEIKSFVETHGKANTELRDSIDLAELVKLAESNVSWLRIKSVEKTGNIEVGYDLTVPGPDTFVSDDGIVLSNTVNIHVPASDKAAKQALEKMLPSKNLFSLTDLKSVRYKPEKEQISGLWALTRGMTRRPVKVYNNKAEAIAAYRRGEIGPNDPVDIE